MSTAPWKFVLPVLAALGHAWWWRGTGPVDDDYIVYRYAQNLVAGHGLVFNPGERFEGFTTPLWVFWHAAWQALGGSSPTLAVGAGVAGWVACVAACCIMAARGALSLWPAWWLAAAPAMAWHAHAGLGTTCMGLALLGAFWAQRRSPWGAGLCLAVACALRQEFVLFVLPVVFGAPREQRLALGLPACLALGGWTAFRLAYYGMLLPVTYATKKLPILADLGYGLSYLAQATWNLGWAGLLAVLIWRAWRERDRRRWAWTVGIVLHSAYIVWVGGDFMVLSRFFVPVFPLLVALVWFGESPTVGADRSKPQSLGGEANRSGFGWVPVLGLAGVLALQWNQVGPHEEARATRVLLQQGFKQRWARLGAHFQTLAPPGTKVALSPIGAFGWASRLPIVDILGLTNPSVVGIAPNLDFIHVKGHHRANFDWVMDQRPEYVILGNGVRAEDGTFTINPWERGFYQSLQQGGRFPQAYRQASMDVGDGMPLDVFIRRDLALPKGTHWVGP